MNNKRMIKIISIILVLCCIIFHTSSVNAFSLSDIINGANDFTSTSKTPLDETSFKGVSNSISSILLTIAVGVTLISGVVLGIQFATQSVEGKAKIKESMVPWIIGIIVAFGAYGIWSISISVFQSI